MVLFLRADGDVTPFAFDGTDEFEKPTIEGCKN